MDTTRFSRPIIDLLPMSIARCRYPFLKMKDVEIPHLSVHGQNQVAGWTNSRLRPPFCGLVNIGEGSERRLTWSDCTNEYSNATYDAR